MDLALISSEVVTTWVTACEEICSATINQRKRVSGPKGFLYLSEQMDLASCSFAKRLILSQFFACRA